MIQVPFKPKRPNSKTAKQIAATFHLLQISQLHVRNPENKQQLKHNLKPRQITHCYLCYKPEHIDKMTKLDLQVVTGRNECSKS